jgi:hypothetical protein
MTGSAYADAVARWKDTDRVALTSERRSRAYGSWFARGEELAEALTARVCGDHSESR